MKQTHEIIGMNRTTILAVAAIILVVIALGIILLTQVLAKNQTNIFFNVDSQLPDPAAALTNSKIGSNGVTEMRGGESYKITFTVHSSEQGRMGYDYTIKSKLLEKMESFTLNPGEDKVVTLTVTPSEDDKFTLDKIESYATADTIDLSRDSWLGEKITFDRSVVFGDIGKAYAYSPISVNVTEFGEILNLNVTLNELREKPYTKSLTDVTSTPTEKTVTEYPIRMWVGGDKLHVETNKTVKHYVSKPEIFQITLTKKSVTGPTPQRMAIMNETMVFQGSASAQDQNPASLIFWYQIR